MPAQNKEKNREQQRKWYAKNKELQAERNKVCRSKIQDWFRQYKSNLACHICGEDHPATIDFHHREPSTKVESVSRMANCGYGKEQVLEEIKKCDIVCANCHRKLHWKE